MKRSYFLIYFFVSFIQFIVSYVQLSDIHRFRRQLFLTLMVPEKCVVQ